MEFLDSVSGRHVRRVLLIFGTGIVAALLPLACGWPWWSGRPAEATAGCIAGWAFGVTAVALTMKTQTRTTGVLFAAATVLWGIEWVSAWNCGPLPLIGEVSQDFFSFFACAGTFCYPDCRFWGRPERAWAVQALVILILGNVIGTLAKQPEWFGYSALVWWPTSNHDLRTGTTVMSWITVFYSLMAITYILVMVSRLLRFHVLDRVFLIPVFGVTSLLVAVYATIEVGVYLHPNPLPMTLDSRLQAWTGEAAVTAVFPLMLILLAAYRRGKGLVVVRRVLDMTTPASAESVRNALRRVLNDPHLDLALWLPDRANYVSAEGRLLGADWAEGAEQAGRRWRQQVTTSQGRILAALDLDGPLRSHQWILQAAVVGASKALETAQVQESALEHVRSAQQRIVRAEAADRLRLERNLHDGVQQHLLAICAQLGVLAADAPQGVTPDRLHACRLGLLDALAELRILAQGIHPPALTQRGLAAALEVVAERLGTRITLTVPSRRFDPDVETTAYYALCEAVTNAVKHAQATRLEVRVWEHGGVLYGEVSDNGVGGACQHPGGGLAGIDDRVHAMRGDVTLVSPAGQGTVLRLEVPCT